jgi:hypothetical protein
MSQSCKLPNCYPVSLNTNIQDTIENFIAVNRGAYSPTTYYQSYGVNHPDNDKVTYNNRTFQVRDGNVWDQTTNRSAVLNSIPRGGNQWNDLGVTNIPTEATMKGVYNANTCYNSYGTGNSVNDKVSYNCNIYQVREANTMQNGITCLLEGDPPNINGLWTPVGRDPASSCITTPPPGQTPTPTSGSYSAGASRSIAPQSEDDTLWFPPYSNTQVMMAGGAVVVLILLLK